MYPAPLHRDRFAVLAIALVCLLAGRLAAADTVHLTNGRQLVGEVVRQDADQVTIKTVAGITLTLAADKVDRIERGPLPDPSGRAGPAGASATTAPARSAEQKLFDASLTALCQGIRRQPSNAPTPVKLGGWAALQVPTASVTGLVLLGEGNTTRKGPRRAELVKLARYVRAGVASDEPGLASHRTWLLSFGVLFLTEVYRESPSPALQAVLARAIKTLESGRHPGKGWNHALRPAKPRYGRFIATTIWATAALANAHDAGLAVDGKGLADALDTLAKSIGTSGGSFYYASGRTTVSPGRTAGVIWVLKRWGGPGFAKKVARGRAFLMRHVESAPKGHASGMMNFGWSALAAGSFGRKTHEAFWRVHHDDTLLKARRADGWFPPQPWPDLGFRDGNDRAKPIEGKGTTWPDRMYGPGWATPWMLWSWQAYLGRNVLTGTGQPIPPPKTQPATAPAGEG